MWPASLPTKCVPVHLVMGWIFVPVIPEAIPRIFMPAGTEETGSCVARHQYPSLECQSSCRLVSMTSDPQSGQYSPMFGFSMSNTMYFLPAGSDIRNHPANIPCKSQGHRLNEDLPWNRTQRRPSVEGQKRLILPQCLYASMGSCCRTSEFCGLGFIFSFCYFYESLYDAVIGLFSH